MERPSKRIKIQDSHSNGTTSGPINGSMDRLVEQDESQDLYLDTVDRTQLDFDQDTVCSVTLSDMNVYACLVCGKYFSGRSKSTPAYFHALDDDHHVYLNLKTLKVYILPDGYENTSPLLNDIKYAVSPTYTPERLAQLDRDAAMSLDLARTAYRPGFIGLTANRKEAHLNVLIQLVSHVPPIRDHLLTTDLSAAPALMASLALLVRKTWSAQLLRAHVNPTPFIRTLTAAQPKSKSAGTLLDASIYLFAQISRHLRKSCFQGLLETDTQRITTTESHERTRFEASSDIDTRSCKFQVLTLDLPAPPLFKDSTSGSLVPQTTLLECLAKFNGVQVRDAPGCRNRYRLLRTGPYVCLYFARFKRTDFSTTRNPTIVKFPLRGLDLAPFLPVGTQGTMYDLLVNVTHEASDPDSGGSGGAQETYRVQTRDKARDTWMNMEDLLVHEIKRDLLNVGAPTLLQIWERRSQ